MEHEAGENNVRIAFDQSNPEAFPLRVQRALRNSRAPVLFVDMDHVSYAGPQALETLRMGLLEAKSAGCEVWLDHIQPGVYKALQLAKLSSLFKRVHHGADSEG